MKALARATVVTFSVLVVSTASIAEVFTGTYVGDGLTSQAITGIPFQPDVLIIKGDDTDGPGDTTSAVFVTATMPGGFAKPLKGTQALSPNLVQSLDANGFTVGGARGTNQLGVQFYFTAFRADANTIAGSYTGNGSTQSLTGFGFTPDYIIIAPESSNHAIQRSYQAVDTWPFWTTSSTSNAVTGLDADGFTLGSSASANEASRTFHYVAWNEVPGKMRTGWYFGDGTDPHAVTDVGFQPQYLIVKAIDQNEHPIQRFAPMTGDTSVNFMSATVNNRIEAFETEGFRVGSHNEVNRNNDAYIYVAFGNGGKPPLTVTETSSRITVRSPDYFEMSFDTAVGGGIEEFFDLASGENRDTDLAGGIDGIEALVLNSVNVGGTWYNPTSNDTGARLYLLEATQTRVKVRQDAFYQEEGGTAIAPGLRDVGDYSVYGTGRMAVGLERHATAVAIDAQAVGLVVHFETIPPLSNWQGYSESGPLPQAGDDDFVLMQIHDESYGIYTDFLHIIPWDFPAADSTQEYGSTPNEWLIGVWEDSGFSPLPAVERIESLVYFKPTDFIDAADPKVWRRRSDYRSPDPLSIALGAGWNENTTNSDFFNESEAAYTLDTDPVSGLRFDMNGSAVARITPFFKIRQWRSLLDPPRVMLEGAVLVNDNQFKADVKPFTYASMLEDFLWHSTFENAAAVNTPDVGSGGAVGGGTTFVPARYGNGGLFDTPLETITVPGAGNIDTALGTAAIMMRPQYDHDDGVDHSIWTYYVDANNFMAAWKRADDFLEFQIRHTGVNTTVQVDPTSYGWRAGDYILVATHWDASAVLGLQTRISINGVEPPHIDAGSPYAAPLAPGGTLYFGGEPSATIAANAVIDEVRVTSDHQELAHGGLGPHPSEYLGTGAKNYALALSPVDGNRRGGYLYFGADAKFRGLNAALATAGVGAVDLLWEYRTPSGWADLESVPGFVDETNHFTNNGSVYWAEDPPGWSLLGSSLDLYYIRVHLESGSYSTFPVENRIATDILLFQYCDDITLAAQTFDFDVAPNPDVSISSAADQTFTVGHLAPPVFANTFTVTDVSGASITAGGDIRIRIPAGFNMRFDPNVTSVALAGSANPKVLPDVVYEDLDTTVVLNVVADFAPGDQLFVDNLQLVSFTAPSPPDSFELEIANDSSTAAVDDKLIEIVPNATPVLSSAYDQWFTVGQSLGPAATMYVTEGLTNFINTSNAIIIRIPAAFDMLWDTSITTAIIGGTGAANVSSAVIYEPGDRGLILNVTNNFAPGQYISISGLGFTGFTAFESPQNLSLDVTTAVDTDDKTVAIDAISDVPFFTATAKDLQVALEWVTPGFGTCIDVRIARRLGADPTPAMNDWFVDIVCGGSGMKHITTDIPPTNGQTYTYGAFVSDGVGAFSGGRLLRARPFDTSGKVKWAYSTAAASMAPPGLRFSGGVATVYAVSNDNILHAIQGAATGGTWPAAWKPYRLGGPAQARPPVVPFAVGSASNGVALLGAQDGNVYAINADDGFETWSQNIGTMVQAAAAGNFSFYDAFAKDLVLVGTRNSSGPNAIAALNVADGAPVWTFTNAAGQGGDDKDIGIISGSAAIDYAARRLIFASRQKTGGSANTVWCIDFDSGAPTIVWARAIGNIDGSPMLLNGVVYAGTNAGALYALDAINGNNMWPPLGLGDGPVKGFVFPQFGTDNRLLSTTTKVWSIQDSGAARSVNPSWPVTATNVPSPSIPTYVPGSTEVLVGSSDGNLYQLNVTTPLPTVSVTLGDGAGAVGVPTVDLLNSMIYVGTDQGVIYGVEFPLP